MQSHIDTLPRGSSPTGYLNSCTQRASTFALLTTRRKKTLEEEKKRKKNEKKPGTVKRKKEVSKKRQLFNESKDDIISR